MLKRFFSWSRSPRFDSPADAAAAVGVVGVSATVWAELASACPTEDIRCGRQREREREKERKREREKERDAKSRADAPASIPLPRSWLVPKMV
jgi:hypothetical protein